MEMKEENFVNKALNILKNKDMEARWIANQALFNGADDAPIQATDKAAVVLSIDIFNAEELHEQLNEHIDRADQAANQGELRAVIAEVNSLLAAK
jgi:hypothetical protein